MLENREDNVLCPCLPKPVNLARRANRARQKLRPKEPEGLFFEIDMSYVPEAFVQDDVTVTGRLSIIKLWPTKADIASSFNKFSEDRLFLSEKYHTLYHNLEQLTVARCWT